MEIGAEQAVTQSMEPPKYKPVEACKAERRWPELRQAMRLPKTLRSIYTMVREDFATSVLDEYLWSFWGFHHQRHDLHYRARPWQKVQLRAIQPQDVVGLEVWEMAALLNIAMEDEEPILEYSHQSGEGFRFLLPTLGRYMGRNEEQAKFAADHGLEWCEGAWCAEERRHSNTLARIIERLIKIAPSRENPNRPMIVTADEADALRHLISRQTTEWNASSSYVVMAAHARSHLHNLIRNLERDEVKHLSIMSAADAYLLGPRPWRRFFDVLRKGLGNYTSQKKTRSGGDVLGTNPITAIEGIAAHLLTEFYLRKWLHTVPLRTLAMVFETPPSMPELEGVAPSPQRRAEIQETLQKGMVRRVMLDRWDPVRRRRALELRRFEEQNACLIEETIGAKFEGFRGAETPGSLREYEIRKQIRRLRGADTKLLRGCLMNCLRDYQVRHNRHVLERESSLMTGDAHVRERLGFSG